MAKTTGPYDHESKLIAGCLRGEAGAQEELYHRYSKAMLNTSYRIVGSQETAEDVLQESFVEVFNKIQSFRGESTIGAWIKRITINKSINHLKKQRLQLEEMGEEHEPVQEEASFDMNLDIQKVKDAILKLPKGFRTVFNLYLLEGYDHQEISQILNISESTSKSQYKRAKDKMRELLKPAIESHG